VIPPGSQAPAVSIPFEVDGSANVIDVSRCRLIGTTGTHSQPFSADEWISIDIAGKITVGSGDEGVPIGSPAAPGNAGACPGFDR
jgi:hypothetical protein